MISFLLTTHLQQAWEGRVWGRWLLVCVGLGWECHQAGVSVGMSPPAAEPLQCPGDVLHPLHVLQQCPQPAGVMPCLFQPRHDCPLMHSSPRHCFSLIYCSNKKQRLHCLLLKCMTWIIHGLFSVTSSRADKTCFTLQYLNYSLKC